MGTQEPSSLHSHSPLGLPNFLYSTEGRKENEKLYGVVLWATSESDVQCFHLFHWLEHSHMALSHCKGGWEMQSSCMPRKSGGHRFDDESVSQMAIQIQDNIIEVSRVRKDLVFILKLSFCLKNVYYIKPG